MSLTAEVERLWRWTAAMTPATRTAAPTASPAVLAGLPATIKERMVGHGVHVDVSKSRYELNACEKNKSFME